jgi:hypothetical protein
MPAKKLTLKISSTKAKHILNSSPLRQFTWMSHDLFLTRFVYKVFNLGLFIQTTEIIDQFFLAAIFE